MWKKSLWMDVYTATMERLEFVFSEFDNIYLSFSAGKDSSVMLHLALQVAKRKWKRFWVLFIDLEAQYSNTINHWLELIDANIDIIEPYRVCLPLHLRNAVSVFEPNWKCWDKEKQRVRNPPEREYVVTDYSHFSFFREWMEFEEFVPLFWKRYAEKNKSVFTACLVWIRADESLNRYRTLIDSRKVKYKEKSRSTKIHKANPYQLYNFYPIYDWKTEDIRTCVGKMWLTYNRVYDKMYLRGKSIHDMRICQPYWDDQRKWLDLFHECEPETWSKILARVSGVNYWALYRWQKVLGNIEVKLPAWHTYKSYTMYLLSTLPKPIRIHYFRRIVVFINWWKIKKWVDGIPDYADKKEESSKTTPSWRRICKAVMKNDYYCKSLSFTANQYEFEKLVEIEKNCKIKEKITELEDWMFRYDISIQEDKNVIKWITLWSKKKPVKQNGYLTYSFIF